MLNKKLIGDNLKTKTLAVRVGSGGGLNGYCMSGQGQALPAAEACKNLPDCQLHCSFLL